MMMDDMAICIAAEKIKLMLRIQDEIAKLDEEQLRKLLEWVEEQEQ